MKRMICLSLTALTLAAALTACKNNISDGDISETSTSTLAETSDTVVETPESTKPESTAEPSSAPEESSTAPVSSAIPSSKAVTATSSKPPATSSKPPESTPTPSEPPNKYPYLADAARSESVRFTTSSGHTVIIYTNPIDIYGSGDNEPIHPTPVLPIRIQCKDTAGNWAYVGAYGANIYSNLYKGAVLAQNNQMDDGNILRLVPSECLDGAKITVITPLEKQPSGNYTVESHTFVWNGSRFVAAN